MRPLLAQAQVKPHSVFLWAIAIAFGFNTGCRAVPFGGGVATLKAYYVAKAPRGNDGNLGTADSPFETLNRGREALEGRPDFMLIVENGIYEVPEGLRFPSGTSWDEPVVVKAHPGHTVRLVSDMDSTESEEGILVFTGNHHIVVDGFIIDGDGDDNGNLDKPLKNGIAIRSGSRTGPSHHIRIQNCEIRNIGRNGVLVSGHRDIRHNEFLNVNIHHTGQYFPIPGVENDEVPHGMYITTGQNLVEGCQIHDNEGWGVHIFSNGPHNIENIVRKNAIYNNNTTSITEGRGAGIGLTSGSSHTVYNNILWGNNNGIQIDAVCHPMVFNNTCTRNVVNMAIGAAGPLPHNALIKNNIVYESSDAGAFGGIRFDGDASLDTPEVSVRTNNLEEDPSFVNADMNDFHLKKLSLAIDKGTTLSEVTDDFDGVLRPVRGVYDIGAYEWPGESPRTTVGPHEP